VGNVNKTVQVQLRDDLLAQPPLPSRDQAIVHLHHFQERHMSGIGIVNWRPMNSNNPER
jgi:hypothetical protein